MIDVIIKTVPLISITIGILTVSLAYFLLAYTIRKFINNSPPVFTFRLLIWFENKGLGPERLVFLILIPIFLIACCPNLQIAFPGISNQTLLTVYNIIIIGCYTIVLLFPLEYLIRAFMHKSLKLGVVSTLLFVFFVALGTTMIVSANYLIKYSTSGGQIPNFL